MLKEFFGLKMGVTKHLSIESKVFMVSKSCSCLHYLEKLEGAEGDETGFTHGPLVGQIVYLVFLRIFTQQLGGGISGSCATLLQC